MDFQTVQKIGAMEANIRTLMEYAASLGAEVSRLQAEVDAIKSIKDSLSNKKLSIQEVQASQDAKNAKNAPESLRDRKGKAT